MNRSNGDNTHSGYCRGAGFTACALLLAVAALKALKPKPWAPTRGGWLSRRMGRLRTARRLFEAGRSFWAGVDRLLGIGVHRSVYKPAMAISVACTAVWNYPPVFLWSVSAWEPVPRPGLKHALNLNGCFSAINGIKYGWIVMGFNS